MERLTVEKLLPAYEIVMQIFSSVESKIGAIYLIRTISGCNAEHVRMQSERCNFISILTKISPMNKSGFEDCSKRLLVFKSFS